MLASRHSPKCCFHSPPRKSNGNSGEIANVNDYLEDSPARNIYIYFGIMSASPMHDLTSFNYSILQCQISCWQFYQRANFLCSQAHCWRFIRSEDFSVSNMNSICNMRNIEYSGVSTGWTMLDPHDVFWSWSLQAFLQTTKCRCRPSRLLSKADLHITWNNHGMPQLGR